ncbi:T9SS type A sorting domain-containing protein [Pinibacter soli]|uniref:T9SS type A sorting domain-containing protein n=1 Tax=Pinibacter soli TaxID=3044211 RepID=A0ABT6R7P4_9BACT|nr:T9SS type A sorting domain-containing protein [Pinibacter soli]MDI3318580.1 T9SS type A sorting domain-containing protein [Pinibacter soli]
MKLVTTAALWLLCVCSFAQVQTRWLGIQGSSTAACFGASSYYNCWVNLLDNYYDKPGKWDTKIDQLAKGGYSPYEGMATSYVSPAGRPAPDPNYDVTKMLSLQPLVSTVIVNYPTNGYDVYTVTESMFCLRAIRDAYTQAGVRCYITTTQPRTSGNFATSDAKKKLAEMKDSILMEFGDYAIDFWSVLVNPVDSSILPQYDSGDQTHLNDAGHQVIFNQVVQKNIFAEPLALPQFLFKAKEENDDNVQLTWKNSRDERVKTFSVQRSDDGSNFAAIYTCGAGADSYTYTDKQPQPGNNFYRLKVEFTSGYVDYSPVSQIVSKSNAFFVSGVVDASGTLKFKAHCKTEQPVVVTIYNANGAVVSNERRNIGEGQTNVTLSNLNLAHGMYYLKCTAVKTGQNSTSAFMVQ